MFCVRCCEATRNAVVDEAKGVIKNAEADYDALNGKMRAQKKKYEEMSANKDNILSANKKRMGELKSQLISKEREAEDLKREVETLKRSAAASAALVPKGLLSIIFSRTQNDFIFPSCLTQQAATFQQQWTFLFPTSNLTTSGEHAYGEPTFGTMARICYIIASELQRQQKPLMPADVLLDWGCGTGKWLCYAREFLGAPGMTAVGVEKDVPIFNTCKANISAARRVHALHRVAALNADSESFTSFCPVRVFVNYDGGSQKFMDTPKSRIHMNILRTAFLSSSVDVIVSTKLDSHTFSRYFFAHIDKLGGSLWKCIYVPKSNYGGSHFCTNIWFRLSPMHGLSMEESCIDPRMEALVEEARAGVCVCVVRMTLFFYRYSSKKFAYCCSQSDFCQNLDVLCLFGCKSCG